MGKSKILSGLALVAGVTALGGVAQADEVQANKEVTENTTTEVNQVTAEQVAQASETASVAQNNVASQSATVAAATSEVASQKALVSELSSQASELTQVTDEDIANAKTSANNAASQVTATSQTAQSTATAESTAQANVGSQSAVVVADQAQVDATQSAVEQAQANVNTLNNPTDTTDLQNQVDTLKTAVSNDEKAVKTAEETLVNAETAQSNKDKAVKDQEAVVSKASDQVNSTKSALDTAKAETEKATSGVSSAQAKLDKAQEGTQTTEQVITGYTTTTTGAKTTLKSGVAVNEDWGTEGIVTSDEYLTALKNLANGTGTVDAVKTAINNGVDGVTSADLGLGKNNNVYLILNANTKAKDSDTTLYNVNNIATNDALMQDMTLFAAALINDLRSKVGTEPLVVTDESVRSLKEFLINEFNRAYDSKKGLSDADLIKQQFSLTDISYVTEYFSHVGNVKKPVSDVTGVSQDAGAMDLSMYDSNDTILALGTVNVNSIAVKGESFTKAQLKNTIIYAISQLLYYNTGGYGRFLENRNIEGDSNFQNAIKLLGLDKDITNKALGFGAINQVSGVSRSNNPNLYMTLSDVEGTVLNNPYQTSTGGTTTTTPIYETKNVTTYDEEAIAQAKADLETAKANLTKAQAVQSQAKTDYDNAVTTYNTAVSTLNDIKNQVVDVATAKANVTSAKQQLANDQSALATAQKALDTANASAQEKAKALATAQANLAKAQLDYQAAKNTLASDSAKLTQLQGILATAQAENEKAQTAYAAALTNLKTANALVDKLTNDQTELPKVQDKLAKAQETLEKLQSILDDETATLETLKETATEAQSAYEALLALYNAQNAQKQQDDIKANGGDPVVTTDDKGNVTGYVDGKVNHTTSKVQNTTNAGITAQTITAAYNKAVTKSVTQAVTAKRATQSSATTYQATLPTTGDSEAALYSLMGLLAFGLAGAGLRKRRF